MQNVALLDMIKKAMRFAHKRRQRKHQKSKKVRVAEAWRSHYDREKDSESPLPAKPYNINNNI